MRWLYENVTGESIVLTVVISTIIIRALTLIGDIKSRQSSMKMQAIQPELDKVRKKYESNPDKMNRETQKLMKANNVSMFGGCLPMLFTMPLFFIFIAAFRQWGNEMMVKLIVLLNENEQAGVEFFKNFRFLWVHNMWMADSGAQPVIATAQNFLASANNLNKLLYLQENPAAGQLFEQLGFFVKDATVKSGYAMANIKDANVLAQVTATYDRIVEPCVKLYEGLNNGWFVFPLVCGGTTWLSSWLMTRGQKANDTTGTTKIMQWVMPIMTFVFCLTSNAAFALYWTISNLVSMVTTFLINKVFSKKTTDVVSAEGTDK